MVRLFGIRTRRILLHSRSTLRLLPPTGESLFYLIMRLHKYCQLIQIQASPPPATIRLPLLPLHFRCRASQGRRKCWLSLHRTQSPYVCIYPSLGVLALLDRRADARYELVQLDVSLLPASPNPTLDPHTCRHRPACLELCRYFVEWSCDGGRSKSSCQDSCQRGDLVYSALWHLFHGRFQRFPYWLRTGHPLGLYVRYSAFTAYTYWADYSSLALAVRQHGIRVFALQWIFAVVIAMLLMTAALAISLPPVRMFVQSRPRDSG